MVNCNEIKVEKITFNYFEPGHTFMSADSFHHQVELSLEKKQKVYDFNDFVDAVKSSCKGNVDVKEMNFNDFYEWKNFTSQMKLKKNLDNRPYLSDMVQIVADRGQLILRYKKSLMGNFTHYTTSYVSGVKRSARPVRKIQLH